MKKSSLIVAGICTTMMLLTACEQKTVSLEVGTEKNTELEITSAKVIVSGFEWGPGVDTVVFQMSELADAIKEDTLSISTNQTVREVNDVYISDENGNTVSGESTFFTVKMKTDYKVSGTPFKYDFGKTFHNQWVDSYPVSLKATVIKGAEQKSLSYEKDCVNLFSCPDTEVFTVRDSFKGTYQNPYTQEKEEITLTFAAYEPEMIAGGEKNPLIIWLHGQGEGGTDPDIAILGNQVSALSKEPIQQYFTAGDEVGAYVLVVQCPTYWMDFGDGTNSMGDVSSRYSEILMDTIRNYVDGREDIDTDRIYLGGCSNGGYMTMNMILSYPDYFAAAYPVCEAYSFYGYEKDGNGSYTVSETNWFTPEKAEQIKDIPIWFVQSVNDTTVKPEIMAVPTYQLLLQSGAENCWFSMFETVEGTESKNGYQGHWSWIYLFHDQVTGVQDIEKVKTASQEDHYGIVPDNQGGGGIQANGNGKSYQSIFEWLNDQRR